jgi:hypothetical protein
MSGRPRAVAICVDGDTHPDARKGEHSGDSPMGLIRYIYPKDELTTMLTNAGFTTTEVPHYRENLSTGYVRHW